MFFSAGGEMWGFQAEKKLGRSVIATVVINGEEYYGENLRYFKGESEEYFLWLSFDEYENIYINQLKIR